MRSKIKAVLLDATGTLFTPHPSVGAVYARVAADFGIVVDGRAIDACFGEEFRRTLRELRGSGRVVWETESGARAFWRRLLNVIFTRLILRPCPEDCFMAIYQVFETAQAWRVFSDVVPTLNLLRKARVLLGIVSNFDERLYRIVQAVGLQRYFRVVLPSTNVGAAKPNREVFLEALRRLNVQPGAALYVGDDPETDAAGAEAAGMRWLLLDRRLQFPAGDTVIHSLLEIPARLQGAPRTSPA